MLKVWGRKTSSNVQKVMWTIGELGLACERVDIGGPFGKKPRTGLSRDEPERAHPDLGGGRLLSLGVERDRALSRRKIRAGRARTGRPSRAGARRPVDGLAALGGRTGDSPRLHRTDTPPVEKRDPKAIEAGKAKTIEAMTILNGQLMKTAFVAGDAFSCGDVPMGVIAHRYVTLVPDHPPMTGLERWYSELCTRPAFRAHVTDIPLV